MFAIFHISFHTVATSQKDLDFYPSPAVYERWFRNILN